MRAGRMVGKTGAYFLAQIIILTHVGTYKTLNEIGFCVSCIVLVFCFFMPRIKWQHIVAKIAAEKLEKKSHKACSPLPTSFFEYMMYRLRKMRSDLVKTYSNGSIRKWSFWWALTNCMSLQVAMYIQTLYGQAQVGDDTPLNAFADAGYTFTSVIFILLTNHFPINWDKWGECALIAISSLDVIFLAILSRTNSIYLMYVCYIFYRSLYQVMITIAQWNIAKKMMTNNYGLVFGINSFIALILQSILVRIVTDKRGFGMQVREAFLVYATLHAFIAVIFFTSVVYSIISYCGRKEKVLFTPALLKKTTRKITHSISDQKPNDPVLVEAVESSIEKKAIDSRESTESNVCIPIEKLKKIGSQDTMEESSKLISASELDSSTDEECESDEEKLIARKMSSIETVNFPGSLDDV